ncbi:MAG: Nif11-like leader peptide family natural product precursor [Ruminiclostridium sp.]|nr:Nif11-like leader peptide family natural product precursor [Ruminiclostridium sp.]
MSKEAASKFVQAILNDEELRQRTEKMKPDEVISFAKEMGYDFTVEELKEAANEVRELSPDELGNVAGGNVVHLYALEDIYCNGDENGSKHIWGSHLEYESYCIFFEHTYEVKECLKCGYVLRVRLDK